MKTLPRHLLLAAVVLTVCCAERGAATPMLDLQKVAAEMAGQMANGTRHVEQVQHRRQIRRSQVRPAAIVRQERRCRVFSPARSIAPPECPVVHTLYPPSRFRLPPPTSLV